MAPIQAVIFDLGNVLCLPPSDEKVARAAADCQLSVPVFLEAIWKERLIYDAGQLTPEQYWTRALASADRVLDLAKLPDLIRHEVEFWNEFDHRVLDWNDRLRAAGLRTAILSNLPRVLGDALRATPGLLDRFDHITFSYEILCAKPDAAIYHHAFEGLSLDPAACVFLDDKQPNVEGAQATGLHAELFPSWEAFLEAGVPARYGLPQPER